MDAMLVVDMQVGLLGGEPKRVSANFRSQSAKVIFIQHCWRQQLHI